MSGRETRIAALAEVNQKRHERSMAVTRSAIQERLRTRKRVNVNAVATQAGVSRTFIYSQPDLLAEIKKASKAESHRLSRPSGGTSEINLRTRLSSALDVIQELKGEKVVLERRIEALTAALARESARPMSRS